MFHRDLRHTGAVPPVPVVRLTSPTNGADYTVGEAITMTADASSLNGSIEKSHSMPELTCWEVL